jgi:hypothetical protein
MTQKGYTEAPTHPEAGDAPRTGMPVNPAPPKGGTSNTHTSPDSKDSRPVSTQAKGV